MTAHEAAHPDGAETPRPAAAPQRPQGPPAADHRFADLTAFMAHPRLSGLALSPDGQRLVTTVAGLNPEGTKWVSALWAVDPTGRAPAARLTRGRTGESAPRFRADGALLFLAERPDPEAAAEPDDPTKALWLLPAAGGEATLLAAHHRNLGGYQVAADTDRVVGHASMLPGSADVGVDEDRVGARKDAGVSAVLFDDYPVRYWDHDLGPGRARLLLAVDRSADDRNGAAPDSVPAPAAAADASAADGSVADGAARERPAGPGSGDDAVDGVGRPRRRGPGSTAQELRLLSLDLPASQDLDEYALRPDGRQVAVTVSVPLPGAARRTRIDLLDLPPAGEGADPGRTGDPEARGAQVTVSESADADHSQPAYSPDGRLLVCVRQRHGSFTEPPDSSLRLVDLSDGSERDLADDFVGWPAHPVFAADGAAVFFTCEEAGHQPVFRLELDTGAVRRLTRAGAYTDLQVARDGSAVYALRAAVDSPPQPVRLSPVEADQDPVPLPNPGAVDELPGRVEEVTATAADGTALRSWLVLPQGAGPQRPAPLLLWIHGGPLMSWNSWSWRWNPWLMAARGYAVLLPDPALSAGYGQDFVRRGWGDWGGAPYTDLMTMTDTAENHPAVDGSRTAAMGGSFGGYMANWVAGHTDRFDAVVTHASLWDLDQFSGTTDAAYHWAREFGDPLEQPERYVGSSPHRALDRIRTPILVIHGDRDYRVPVGEALRLWFDLQRRAVRSRFLYFPDENHWILTPGNAAIWYETVFAFLAEHVLGTDWVRPRLL